MLFLLNFIAFLKCSCNWKTVLQCICIKLIPFAFSLCLNKKQNIHYALPKYNSFISSFKFNSMKYPQLISMPSEISDWLEQQLEARDIDAVVYTRYILSLLHRDTADFISSYQENNFKTYDEALKRSRNFGGRKRFRHSSEWAGRHAQVDADQLKRSAAVECLLSASDQDCGIENLVDELCEKLKQYNNGSCAKVETTNIALQSPAHDVSPLDLARQYYAAFPPLSSTSVRSPGTLLAFVPQCYTSPKKKGTRRRHRSSSCGDKLHYKKECVDKNRTNGKHKFGHNWNVVLSKKFLNYSDKGDAAVKKEKPKKLVNENDYSSLKKWGNDCKENEMYDDLPVDIIELLDSPSPHDYSVEMMNLANIKEVGNKSFIHSGTNITSSIWSFDAAVSSDMDKFRDNNSETVLGFKFSSLTMDCQSARDIWSDVSEENRMLDIDNNYYSNFFYEGNRNSSQVTNHPWNISKKWSEGGDFVPIDRQTNILLKSLIKINHSSECSSFIEVSPGNRLLSCNSIDSNYAKPLKKCNDDKKTDENLLTSDSSHFKPIHFKKETNESNATRQYADGTSFVISSNLDKPNYRRSSSGYLYLDSEWGSPQKMKELNDDKQDTAREFVLKFFVKQNDKACQTDAIEVTEGSVMDCENENSQVVPCKKRNLSESEFYFPGDQELLNESEVIEDKKGGLWMLDQRLEDTTLDTSMNEVMWRYNNETCSRCNNNQWGNEAWVLPEGGDMTTVWQLDKDSLRNIWKGGEVSATCDTCSGHGNKFSIPYDSQQNQLREDISQDGEQLLSDLSTLQKSYMEHLPVAEVSYDINELLTAVNDRKRRHSPAPAQTKSAAPTVQRGSWTFASNIKQDHLMQMSSVPVLHSVTL